MQTAIRIPPLSPLDIVGMERWLEQMAAKGLFLRRYRDSFCIFTKGEPKRPRYRLEANPRNLLEDEAPKDKTELDRCLGWDNCCEVPYSFLAFSSGDPMPRSCIPTPPSSKSRSPVCSDASVLLCCGTCFSRCS